MVESGGMTETTPESPPAPAPTRPNLGDKSKELAAAKRIEMLRQRLIKAQRVKRNTAAAAAAAADVVDHRFYDLLDADVSQVDVAAMSTDAGYEITNVAVKKAADRHAKKAAGSAKKSEAT